MKKLNILLLAGSLIAMGTLTTSCGKDFLDKTPQHSYTADTYYSSDAAVMKAIEPLYNYAWFNYNYRAMVGMGSARANDGWNPYLNPQFATFQVTGLDGDLANAWKSFYLVVSMSNQLISDVNTYCTEAVSEEVKNLALGEAYLMRGWAYFYLLRSWGDVIVYEDNLEMTNTPVVPLTKEEDVLKFVVRDARRAVELLPVASTSNHATKYSAEGLLAKALLAQSGWGKNGTRDQSILDEVVDLCDDIINNGPYTLMPDYADLFKYDNNNFTMQNSETLLAMHWADPLTATWGTYSANYSDLAWSGSSDVNVWGGIYASVDMLDLYNEDISDSIRFQATFCLPGIYYNYWDTGNDLVAASDKTPEKGYPQPTGYVYNKKFCQLKKWVVGTKADCQGHLAQMASPLNTYIQRLADIYLIKAEAILGNDDTTSDAEGLEAINAVRARAKVKDMLTSYGLAELIKERRKEFCMEFSNWYDMVTWYRWQPQYMLDYFNNKQHRAFMVNQGDVLYNADRSISYRTFPNRQSSPWYFYDDTRSPRGCYWNDCMREEDSETVIQTKEQGYVYDVDALSRARDGYDPVTLSETNIFMPYPEADVIRNPYFKEPAQNYDFGDEK
ncbi:RagB/SusD family nutrient uptake outer membrane protein [Prevotella sp. tf2-5]|uniref:RagB/SusD family nutrient uptake outer membrane protein n=1 Tax=Prevotella sp. tf2-5 TaxID=1761889 RepID=UPI0008F10B96|nr:RagB/SusD family nutrient uptake outer membrane protein [Prevotella sp. tf2-5]SFO52144.1 Starch-binding associating with outer membrane [Prevotella sp. tf2-5]